MESYAERPVDKKIYLDGKVVTEEQFNERVKTLKNNQRIVESGSKQFVVVERLFD